MTVPESMCPASSVGCRAFQSRATLLFVKQKTAYELPKWLEFRRVLFRSWVYSTPTHLEYAVEHIADRAQAYGFEGVVVDGTDVLAVYREARRAIEKAREGEGPTLIERSEERRGGQQWRWRGLREEREQAG